MKLKAKSDDLLPKKTSVQESSQSKTSAKMIQQSGDEVKNRKPPKKQEGSRKTEGKKITSFQIEAQKQLGRDVTEKHRQTNSAQPQLFCEVTGQQLQQDATEQQSIGHLRSFAEPITQECGRKDPDTYTSIHATDTRTTENQSFVTPSYTGCTSNSSQSNDFSPMQPFSNAYSTAMNTLIWDESHETNNGSNQTSYGGFAYGIVPCRNCESLKRKLHELEMDNQRLIEETHQLKRVSGKPQNNLECSPGKIAFLETLVKSIKDYNKQTDDSAAKRNIFPSSRASTSLQETISPNDEGGRMQYCQNTLQVSMASDTSTCNTEHLPEAYHNLVPLLDSEPDILLSKADKSKALLLANGKPELLVRCLMDCFFSTEEQANGCALGNRNAHNSKEKTVPLDHNILGAIKRFVLAKFKRPDGSAALQEKEFNSVINSKFATSRRKLATKNNFSF